MVYHLGTLPRLYGGTSRGVRKWKSKLPECLENEEEERFLERRECITVEKAPQSA